MVPIRPAVDGCSGLRPATVGCRVACAPRAHNQRRPRVGRERGRSPACTPRTIYVPAYWPAFASVTCELGCLSPTRASGGRSEQNNKSRRRGEFRKNNIEVFLYIYIIYIYIYNYHITTKFISIPKKNPREPSENPKMVK